MFSLIFDRVDKKYACDSWQMNLIYGIMLIYYVLKSIAIIVIPCFILGYILFLCGVDRHSDWSGIIWFFAQLGYWAKCLDSYADFLYGDK